MAFCNTELCGFDKGCQIIWLMDFGAGSNFRLLQVDDSYLAWLRMDVFQIFRIFFFLVLLFRHRFYHLNVCDLKPEITKLEALNVISEFK